LLLDSKQKLTIMSENWIELKLTFHIDMRSLMFMKC
jgi:hypothetical protein